jgi:cellulose synthase/poly-beta-1,6-N-acetylglucosamine synthase-like glycosyltransferase
MSALGLVALVAGVLVLVPSAVLALVCLAACLPSRPRARTLVRVPRTAVLVPAHVEEASLPAALRTILPELAEHDRLVVVAHNCTDRTAMLARALGAEVVEAHDDGTHGKPAALRAGLAHLDREPPEVVVIVDADCNVERGAIRTLALAAASHGGPVQGDYRLERAAPGERGGPGPLAELALLVKNHVRPLGLARLGLPCLLNGAGSAYPFALLRDAPHGRGSIAEDYQLALDLAARGHGARYVPVARVRSVLPAGGAAARGQRRRWEHGHLALVVRAPQVLLRGLVRRRAALFFLGVDLLVPPLALLVLAWTFAAGLATAAYVSSGAAHALVIVSAAAVLLAGGLGAALGRFGESGALPRALAAAPRYVLGKLPLYLGFVVRRETRWRRTERDAPPEAADAAGGDETRGSETGT